MTSIEAYILAKKIALGAVSGIKNITLSPTGTLMFVFNDGSSTNWQIPLPQNGEDGLSITSVQIDANKHLICTMSDGSTIDAGQIPGGGGLAQVANSTNLPAVGDTDTLYLTLDNKVLHYWDSSNSKYEEIAGGGSVEFKTSTIEFDGLANTFDLPTDSTVNVYVNGMYLTEGEDYNIDNTVSPNTITFGEIWDTTDLCTLTWIVGSASGSGGDIGNATLATKQDILDLFKEGDNP